MNKSEMRDDYPTYQEVVNTPYQAKLWQPFQANSNYSKSEAAVANTAVLVAVLLLIAMVVSVDSGVLFLINVCRDTIVQMMPGCANFADFIGMALKVLVTVTGAWFMKLCWTCWPYVVSKLRENPDEIF